MDYFFEIHKGIPREGPGDAHSTRKAWEMCTDLPEKPKILDIGCGPGMQSFDLLSISNGWIIGLDTHFPFLLDCRKKSILNQKFNSFYSINASMHHMPFAEYGFDVIWCEGAIYNMGFQKGLYTFHPLLKTGGYMAVTEISWIADTHPSEISNYWEKEYPGINTVEDNLKSVTSAGFELIGHFILPESSWFDNYYNPLFERIIALQNKYQDEPEFQSCAAETIQEIEMFQKYSKWYGYVFYIMRLIRN